jgi:hypothetical protein
MKFQTKTILTAGDVSGNLTSDVIDLRFNYGFAVQCLFTGAPTGNVIIQGSNDESNWSTITTIATSGTTTLASNNDGIFWPYVRVTKAAGGTGTMTVTITIKGA